MKNLAKRQNFLAKALRLRAVRPQTRPLRNVLQPAGMAAASLLTFNTIANPNRNPNPNYSRRCSAKPLPALARLSLPSPRSQFDAFSAIRLDSGRGLLASDGRIPRGFAAVGSYDESTHPDIEVEKEKDELKTEANEAQEAWKETLETFKVEALKMKEMSQEAYKEYSKKAMVILKETSEKLKIRAEKSRQDLSIVAQQISEEGKVYLSTATEKSPDSVKDVVETFASSTDELKEVSAVRDFYLGIPYGAFLSIGGFLSFMLTGSISAIRFGVILGSALLALSVASLRSWKSGKPSELLLKGQAAIAAIIFLREWRLLFQTRSFSTLLMTLISGAMVAFYVYRIIINGSSKGPSSEHSSEN